jgi:integral membrane sensor domain MASE1
MPRKILCGQDSRCRTLADVFRFAVSAACAPCRAALTAASALLRSALLSSSGVLAYDGARR